MKKPAVNAIALPPALIPKLREEAELAHHNVSSYVRRIVTQRMHDERVRNLARALQSEMHRSRAAARKGEKDYGPYSRVVRISMPPYWRERIQDVLIETGVTFTFLARAALHVEWHA